jgi:hypothetical protein
MSELDIVLVVGGGRWRRGGWEEEGGEEEERKGDGICICIIRDPIFDKDLDLSI